MGGYDFGHYLEAVAVGVGGGTFCAIGAAKGVLAHDFVHFMQPGGTLPTIFVQSMKPWGQREHFFSVFETDMIFSAFWRGGEVSHKRPSTGERCCGSFRKGMWMGGDVPGFWC